MADDFPMNEGIGGPASNLGGWSWSGILAYTTDMYGGVGGQMAAGGITGMPAPDSGSSGSWVPGSGGDGSTPPDRENELLNPNGLPVPRWTPGRGSPTQNGISNLYAAAAGVITSAAANAPHEVNSGLWGVSGFGWSDVWPVDPRRVQWFGPRKAGDKYQTMPTKHPQGPRVDPSFEQIPEYSQDFDFLRNSPYENEVPYQYFHQIGDVVTFPGNPANDNNPTGPGGGPHVWENYRRQIQLQKAISDYLAAHSQDHFFGP